MIGTITIGHGASIDVDVLLATRLLIQANSGGGKSYLLRRLAEQLFGKVPVIIIDPEGEFATLREKYARVLCGAHVGVPQPSCPVCELERLKREMFTIEAINDWMIAFLYGDYHGCDPRRMLNEPKLGLRAFVDQQRKERP